MRVPSDLPTPSTERLALVLSADLGLLTLAEGLRQHWTAHAAALGLSSVQIKVLLTLEPGETIPMRELAGRLDYDASNLTTLVDRLERRGSVQRESHPTDRRVKTLALTPAGEQLRATFWRELLEDPGPLAPLDTPALRTLVSVLEGLNQQDDRDAVA
ncbi:MAG: MarR family transcriptional regulator [Actinomycetota bacterium]|nr:MarR family transcriptional regulator [Actinomycetota bacterium]